MPAVKQPDRPTTRLFLCQTPEKADHLPVQYLGDSERIRLERYRGQRYREFLQSRVLLREALSAVLPGKRAAGDWQITERAEQPPLVGDVLEMGWHYSLSHSQNWIAVALSNSGPCGIDLEYHRARANLAQLAAHWFHPDEARQLASQSGKAQLTTFYRLWTLKEALIKSRNASVFSGLLGGSRFVAIEKNEAVATPCASYVQLPGFPFSLAVVVRGSTALHISQGYPLANARSAAPRITRYRVIEH